MKNVFRSENTITYDDAIKSTQDYYNFHGLEYAHSRMLPSANSKSLIDTFLSHFSLLEKVHVLDAGCGTGADVSYLAQKQNVSVIGGEISRTLLSVCKLRLAMGEPGEACITALDASGMPFGEQTFDGIIHKATFLHFPLDSASPKCAIQVMAEAYRVLKKGGFLYILTRRGRGCFVEPQTNRFFQLYEINDLESLARGQGFNVLTMQNIEDTRYLDPTWQKWLSATFQK